MRYTFMIFGEWTGLEKYYILIYKQIAEHIYFQLLCSFAHRFMRF